MTRRTSVVRLLLCLAALWSAGAAAQGDTPYLATIAIERAPGMSGPLGEHVVSTLHVNDPQKTAATLAQIDGLDIIETGVDTVSIRSTIRPTVAGEAHEKFLRSTWVVDFNETSLRELTEKLASQHDARPTPAEIKRFVFEHIGNKSYSRSFDLASRVAATGEGDCTEHAVLLAALARANGHFARVVFGNLILDTEAGLFAFGHAWTEIHDDAGWQIEDATMPDNDPSLHQLRYLPIGILQDEGPAYFLSLVDAMGAMPARITGVGTVP